MMACSQNFDGFLGVHLEIMSKLLQSNREDEWNEDTILFFQEISFFI